MEVWTHILTIVKYDGKGDITINANTIKSCKKTWKGKASQFEPRLLCYQPSLDSRPSIFKEHKLSIFPINNGIYVISKATMYKELEYTHTPEDVTIIQRDTTSKILSIGESETSLIDNMRYSGIFERPEILDEPITHGPLLNGRHRCSSMKVNLNDKDYDVKSVQFEVDSCYESKHKVLIIEGKSLPKGVSSFNIRQLFIPFREISKKITDKEIVCLFIHEWKNIIHVWKYTFTDDKRVDSIKLLGYSKYKFSS